MGVSTKLRFLMSLCGIVSLSVSNIEFPHRRMSISTGRGAQRGPDVRPNACSISSIQFLMVSGEACVSHSAARFRKGVSHSAGEFSGSRAGDSTTGEIRFTVSSNS